jgi:type VI protein secretion system component VasK
MELLIPLMPLFGALPLGVAAVVIAKIWQKRRAAPLTDLETQNEEFRMELQTLRHELQEVQERLDFAERALTQQRRLDALPNPLPRPGSGNV